MLDEKYECKLTDFDSATYDMPVSKYMGTLAYCPPEIISESLYGKSNTKSIDIWCLGVILLVMATKKHPFLPTKSSDQQYDESKSTSKDLIL